FLANVETRAKRREANFHVSQSSLNSTGATILDKKPWNFVRYKNCCSGFVQIAHDDCVNEFYVLGMI
ncbi:O-fucosyltransferase family protein, partial [Prunus dulcis]